MKSFDFNQNSFRMHHTLTDVPREEDFPLHAHDTYEIYCFLEGQGYYTVEGHDYPLSHGCVLLMRDGETHKLHISPQRPYERIALHFSPELFKGTAFESLLAPFAERPLGQKNMIPPCPALSRAVDMLLAVTRVGEHMPIQADTLRYAYLPAILAEINVAVFSDSGTFSYERKQESLLVEIIDFINQNPAAVDNVDMLETVFGYSRSYLNRIFRRSTGVPIWDYVILKRLTMARMAIRNGSAAAMAAKAAGFSDYSSFYRQYKKRFGLTPEEDKKALSPKVPMI